MSKNVAKLKATDGSAIELVKEVIAEGAKKIVYFSPDRSYVVALFKKEPDKPSLERLEDLIGRYRTDIFTKAGGEYWKKRFCWPTHIVRTDKGKTGIVIPTYPQDYFFQYGTLQGTEKKGSWFTKPIPRSTIDPREKGNWKNYLLCCLHLSRTIRRMHASGLAHSDLSFNNVLLNPAKGTILIIDIDELVVPGKYSPGVIGTKGFIAPEVLMTSNLALGDPNKYLPRRETDLHALACLIYLYLLRRHPLEGMKTYHDDPEMDDYLAMGEKALFIEHSTDSSNRPAYAATQSGDLSDVNKYPFSITGPFLAKLFRQAFEAGLHNPSLRPIANEWETALIQTYERLVPCSNPLCQEKYFVYSKNKSCPFCGTKLRQEILVIDVYKYDNRSDGYLFSKSQIVGYNGKKLYRWHFYANKFLNESLSADEAQHLAYLQFHNGSWVIVNVGLDDVIVNNSDGIDHFLVKNAYCQIADGSTITVTEKPNGHQLKFKFG